MNYGRKQVIKRT